MRCAARVGPRDREDSQGGDLLGAGALTLTSLVPKFEQQPLRLHAFLNAGNVISRAHGDDARTFFSSLHASVGTGLVVDAGKGRLEFNFFAPILGLGSALAGGAATGSSSNSNSVNSNSSDKHGAPWLTAGGVTLLRPRFGVAFGLHF